MQNPDKAHRDRQAPRSRNTGSSQTRINLFMARAGAGSRRACDEMVLAGRVTINGELCLKPGTKVSPDDVVRLDNRPLQEKNHLYLILNKPAGYVCSRSDELGKKTIYELLPKELRRANYIGRLDKDSRGLLLLTTDGALAHALGLPKSRIEKEYEVVIDRPVTEKDLAGLIKGTFIEGRRARAESVRQIGPRLLRIVLTQGIKRQIRVMLHRLGIGVKDLNRIRFGPIRLGAMPQGMARHLRPREIESLRAALSERTSRPARFLPGTDSSIPETSPPESMQRP